MNSIPLSIKPEANIEKLADFLAFPKNTKALVSSYVNESCSDNFGYTHYEKVKNHKFYMVLITIVVSIYSVYSVAAASPPNCPFLAHYILLFSLQGGSLFLARAHLTNRHLPRC